MKSFLFVSIVALTLASNTNAQEKVPALKVPELTELQTLKAQNFQLKVQLTQCRVDLLDNQSKVASATLTSEQSKLEVEFRKSLGCKETQKFNWQTLGCEDVQKTNPIIK